MHLVDEVAQHLLADLEIGDDAVLQGTYGLDVGGGTSDHALGLEPHRERSAVAHVDGHHGRLVQHDPVAAHIDQVLAVPSQRPCRGRG
jgi:hypothetical protein